MKTAGVEFVDRVSIDSAAVVKAVVEGASIVDLIAYHVSGALERLDEAGADIAAGHTIVSIGQHPDHPGAVTIEAKANTRKRAE